MAIDRRVQRTWTALFDALVRLIRTMPYAEISVGDILAEADIGRSTFYAHFRSKDELLDRSLDRLKHLLVATIAAEGGADKSFWACTKTLFEHLGEYRDIHAALREDRGGEVLHAALTRV
ncbi:MAG TPA: helix-turn-helix domain-containing protein, partial [Devosia sp.]